MSIFDKWNKNIDEDFVKGVEELDAGGGDFEKVPYGIYDVKIMKMELKESKNGDPMLQVLFKILAGSEKGNTILMNRLLNIKFQIHTANDFLRSLDTGLEIKFKDYGQYNDLIMDVFEKIGSDKLEYALKFSQNEKGYDTFEITEVFDNEE